MRLKDYLKLSCKDKDLNEFRSLKVGFTVQSNKNKVKKILKEFKFDNKLIKEIEKTNNIIKKMSKTDFILDFCDDMGTEHFDNININEKRKERLKMKLFEFNNELSIIQKNIERKIKKGEE